MPRVLITATAYDASPLLIQKGLVASEKYKVYDAIGCLVLVGTGTQLRTTLVFVRPHTIQQCKQVECATSVGKKRGSAAIG